ncbi:MULTISPECIES: S1/P1 nuclease [unclassified Thalassolituus]|uniref:S1/P1 nuclease n=1 Tax=unclassified Thalassolituus TaxID=2624967 RepID=UPI0025EB4D4D|nr:MULTISPECIES: S1/P1 nuclease [unclassified Thalassolituus]
MQRPMQRLCVRYSLALMLIFQLAVLSAPQARAFEVRAHIAACELAWQLAQPQTRQWLKDTLRDSPFKRFNAACPWPDKARDESRFKDTGPWHYVNVDENAVKVSEQDCSRKGCVLTAIEAMKQRLLQASSPSPSTLTSTPTPTSAQTGAEISGLNRQYRTDELEPWQALLFFSHFVTDLHQPLHVSYADDRGGNRAKIKFNGEWTNLHRLWDGELLGMYSVSQLINDWQQHPVSDDRLQGTTAEWATESLLLTRRIYLDYQQRKNKQQKEIGDQYQAMLAPALEQRLQLAGSRLAAELDAIATQVTARAQAD